jgi:hypothetical protein
MSNSKQIILKIVKSALLTDLDDSTNDNGIAEIFNRELSKVKKRDINKIIRDKGTVNLAYSRFSVNQICISNMIKNCDNKISKILEEFFIIDDENSNYWNQSYSFKKLEKRKDFNFKKHETVLYKFFAPYLVTRLFHNASKKYDQSIIKYSLYKGNGIFLYHALKRVNYSYRYDLFLKDKKVQNRLANIFVETKDKRLKLVISKEISGIDNIIRCLRVSKDLPYNSTILVNLHSKLTEYFLGDPIKFLKSDNLNELLEMMSKNSGYKYSFGAIYFNRQTYCMDKIVDYFLKLKNEKQRVAFALELYEVLNFSDSFSYNFKSSINCALEIVVANLNTSSLIYLMGYQKQDNSVSSNIIKNNMLSASSEYYC